MVKMNQPSLERCQDFPLWDVLPIYFQIGIIIHDIHKKKLTYEIENKLFIRNIKIYSEIIL